MASRPFRVYFKPPGTAARSGGCSSFASTTSRVQTSLVPVAPVLGPGNLFATGLVAGGALMGVFVAFLAGAASYLKDNGKEGLFEFLNSINFEERISHAIGHGWFQILGVAAFAVMGAILFKVALKPVPKLD